MLVNKNIWDRKQSVYSCDRCKAPLNYETKIAIYVALPSRQPRKKWDLCGKCYKALVKGIEKLKDRND